MIQSLVFNNDVLLPFPRQRRWYQSVLGAWPGKDLPPCHLHHRNTHLRMNEISHVNNCLLQKNNASLNNIIIKYLANLLGRPRLFIAHDFQQNVLIPDIFSYHYERLSKIFSNCLHITFLKKILLTVTIYSRFSDPLIAISLKTGIKVIYTYLSTSTSCVFPQMSQISNIFTPQLNNAISTCYAKFYVKRGGFCHLVQSPGPVKELWTRHVSVKNIVHLDYGNTKVICHYTWLTDFVGIGL